MRVRVRMPELDAAAREALERKARLFLGRHVATIDSVEIASASVAVRGVEHADCELVVRMRDGTEIRVLDDRDHSHRAFLRAAWRLDQRRELGRLRGDPLGRAS